MPLSKSSCMRLHTLALVAAWALVLSGCGGDPSPLAGETLANEKTAAPANKDTSDSSSLGKITFTIDGQEMSFDYMPESECRYHRLASSMWAYPAAGAKESVAIHFMSIDLKGLSYPAALPPSKDLTKPMDAMAAMASVGFGYINAEGVEWAGSGKIYIESFDKDGTLQGTFDGVSLPHTDRELPNVLLTDGTFRVRISTPW